MAINRILKLVKPEPNEPDDNPFLREMDTAKETEVSALHPVDIYLPRAVLIEAIEEALLAIDVNQHEAPTDSQTKNFIRSIRQQRVEFLEWLRANRSETVFVALYPTGDDAMVEEPDVLALTEDEDVDRLFGMGGDDEEREDDLPLG